MSKRGSWQVFGLMALTLCMLLGWLYYLSCFTREQAGTQNAEKGPSGVAAAADQRHTAVYDYSKPVPAAEGTIAADYFQDAVFIGDSRTTGLQLFGGPPEAVYYTAAGLKVDTVLTKPVVTAGELKITIMEALRQHKFGKIYIMLGVNELGWAYSELFIQTYGEVIAEIKEIAPQAIIYVQSILPVTKEKSLTDKIYNQQNINKYNELIRKMAAEQQVYYLDAAAAVQDDEGYLPAEAATDGIHLKPAYCRQWFEYLQQHYITGGVVNEA